ncbi:DUF5979 domain-containing protein [Leucobacter sp. USHLN153]|uniref:DUF5979 domain-containing protein n=1 Tax=Leucobacter sp. USHLN153 TaxID=3081268 RepID=UPI003016BD5F
MIAAVLMVVLGLTSVAPAAMAAQNERIILDGVTIGGGTGPDGQLVVGDTVSVSATWNATSADPHEGDSFTIGVPRELRIPSDVPFPLTGPRQDGSSATWATCLATAAAGEVVCTLTAEVEANPELVNGEFSFDIEAAEATTANELNFNLNGQFVPVALPGEGGIDDGIVLSDDWSKSGEMNDNNWSMTWTIDLPGSRMQGEDAINVADALSATHVLCEPANLKVVTVRGDSVADVSGIAEITPGADAQHFTIGLDAPEPNGFDANVTYRITYDTCTPDGQIDPEETEYTNEASIDVWGESSGIIGVHPNPWHEDLTKTGTVLGGADRNGKIAWTVTVPGDQLVGKDGFNFSETLGAGHELCTDTISNLRVTERYGPSDQLQRDTTGLLTQTVNAQSAQAFDIDFAINDSSFEFRPSDYRYVITYTTCVTETDLPEGGTAYSNQANVDGVVAGTEAEVPGRTDQKNGSINSKAVTIDGVQYLPQTTMNWSIVVPGERLQDVVGDLSVTDTLSGAHQVCAAGDPSGGLASRLALKVEARDQISGGGLSTVDLTDSVTAEQNAAELTFTIPRPELPQPDGSTATAFSTEYQYVISYTTCTTSGGMDAPGTEYGNTAVVNGKTYDRTVTQNNRGSGSGSGVPRGSIAIDKLLADTTGAQFVPEDASFTVHVKEIDPSGATQVEYDLQIPLNGDPVSGPNSRGTGWTAELSEPTFPNIPGVVFGTPAFAPGAGLTVSEDGATAIAALEPGSNIGVSLTNTAQLGSLSIVKRVEGGAAERVDEDLTYAITAHVDTSALGNGFPSQADRELTLTADEPAALEDLPIGAVVTFTEAKPADDDQFTWGDPVFSPESVTVSAENATVPAAVTVTNTVERTLGTFSLVKRVTGDQADNAAVPDEVTVTATWNEEGTPGAKTLTLPTDGTPVPFDEDLLIGTEVTLTETPLIDRSSIAWADPTWSGTGVAIDGHSAVVTVTRGADITVNLENQATTSVAGLSLIKGIAGEAAGEVAPSTEFPVTATWVDAEGVDQSRNLTINAESPTSLGEDLPAGTVVTITEGESPKIDTVVWGSVFISGDDVTDEGDRSAEIVVSDQQGAATLVTVTNEATWAAGTFSLSKEVAGVSLKNADVPDSVEVTATWIEDAEPTSVTLTVPTDGSAIPLGRELPHGTQVSLSEAEPDDSAAFTWASPEWEAEGIVSNQDDTATITIGAAEDTAVTVTNRAIASLGSLTVTKSLSGDGASEVPDGTEFPVTATWTDLLGEQHNVTFDVTAGTPAVLSDLPLGTEVTLSEGSAELPSSITWKGASWLSDDDAVAVNGEGNEVIVTVTGEPDASAEIDLQNRFDKVPALAITGGHLWSAGAAVAVLLLLGGGVLLLTRQTRRA